MAKPLNATVSFVHGNHSFDFTMRPNGGVTIHLGRRDMPLAGYQIEVMPGGVFGLANFLGSMSSILSNVEGARTEREVAAVVQEARERPRNHFDALDLVQNWILGAVAGDAPIMAVTPCEYHEGACVKNCAGGHTCPKWYGPAHSVTGAGDFWDREFDALRKED